jgi:hypothetical protein
MYNQYEVWRTWSCPNLRSSLYNCCKVIWTVLSLTAAKIDPTVMSMWGFTLPDVPNIFIFVILYDFCLLSTGIINIRYLEIYVQIEVEVSLRPTVSRPVSLGVRPPSGTRDQFFFLLEIFFKQVRVCYFVAPSLTTGLVCNLKLLLVLASAVTLGRPFLTRDQVCLLSAFCYYQSIGSQYVHKTFT